MPPKGYSKFRDFYDALIVMQPDDTLIWKTEARSIGTYQKALETWRRVNSLSGKLFRVICFEDKLYVIRVK